ncbi:cytochrome b/b6 domain-containing protein [Corynebacterium mayonis]|uniref:cytochrome b/b6 domain-containing protein n=1 Tax=Corynebacterium mayonis TaxID=3062461 RepID=UPI00313FEDD3
MQVLLRRGLPRTPGGDPWPPAGSYIEVEQEEKENMVSVALRRGLPRTPGGDPWPPAGEILVPDTLEAREVSVPDTLEAREVSAPQSAAAEVLVPKPQSAHRWATLVRLFIGVGFIFGFLVLLARFVLGTQWGTAFIATYDGKQPLPDNTPIGLPAWLNWAHFLNMFLMALVVKTGIQIRREKRPPAYWTPRNNPRGKISLTLWLHLMLDIAWLVLGAVFYVLLFATGQWVRIVPTSIEVIPHAVSAGLQYMSMNWPTEHGWVHYNALQELTYFVVVFVAAPISALTGLRMSPWWPQRFTFIKVSTARALHFPTMVFFVCFIIAHVVLVALTGLRQNLNAMFAAHDGTGWLGAGFFLVGAAIIVVAAWAARPAVVAPLASLTGKVSNR